MPLFTILLPVHRNADLIPYAIESILSQTITDFELFIIADGAPLDTLECARIFAKRDHRVRLLSFPKGERHGEAYRHIALQQGKGHYVAHICDDDLWFPNHLEEMLIMLNQADFGNLLFCYVDPHQEEGIWGFTGDLSDPAIVKKMIEEPFNFFGPTVVGYTMAAYKKLADGWSPAPPGVWTDLYMWRKFLRTPGLTFKTRASVTSCHFSAAVRPHLSIQDRKIEIEKWFKKIQSREERERLAKKILGKINA